VATVPATATWLTRASTIAIVIVVTIVWVGVRFLMGWA